MENLNKSLDDIISSKKGKKNFIRKNNYLCK